MSFLKRLFGKDKSRSEASRPQTPTQTDLNDLLRLLIECFSLDELRVLCFDLGINPDFLPGEERTAKARALIAYFSHPTRSIDRLIQACARRYPDVPWNAPATARHEPHSPGTLIRLRQLILYCFNENELRDLCLDLGLDYDDLPGAARAAKIIELVQYYMRPPRSENELIKVCRELRPNAPWDSPTANGYEPYKLGTLAELRRMLTQHLDESQVRELCTELGVDYRRLPGADRGGTARELVLHLARRGRLLELVETCSQRHPDVPWMNLLDRAGDEQTGTKTSVPSVDLDKLRQALSTQFSDDQLRDLCLELGMDYDDLPGPDKVRELVMYFRRRRRIPELAEASARLRPDVPWWG